MAGDGTITIYRCMQTDQICPDTGIADWCCLSDHKDYTAIANNVRILLAPELEKAGKWDRVKEIAKRNGLDEYPCEGCPVTDMCDSSDSLCGQAESIVDALEGERK